MAERLDMCCDTDPRDKWGNYTGINMGKDDAYGGRVHGGHGNSTPGGETLVAAH